LKRCTPEGDAEPVTGHEVDESGAPGPAPEFVGEDPGGDDRDDPSLPPRGRPLLLRLAAAAVLVAVTVFLLGGVLRLLSLPVPPFLEEAFRLAEDPQVRRWQAAVVVVRAGGPPSGPDRVGTGFNIDPAGLIVTNRHVVEGARWVEAGFQDGTRYPAAGIVLDTTADLALIRLQASALPALPVAEGPAPAAGARVTIVGNPLGYARLAVRGTVAGYAARPDGLVMQVDAPIQPGHSGSPVVDDAGRVVGVIFASAGAAADRPLGYAVPVERLHRLLASDGLAR